MKTTWGARAYLQGEHFEYLEVLLIWDTSYVQL